MGSHRHATIGVYGGSFDPPHLGHVALATAAVEQLALDQLVVIPTGSAWYKTRSLSSGEHRLAMTRMAFSNCPKTVVSDIEIYRQGPCYTIDTLEQLKIAWPNSRFYLIMGADQAAKITTWHRWSALLDLATLAVVDRGQQASQLLLGQGITQFVGLHMPPSQASSTHIRALVGQGAAPESFTAIYLAAGVARYIHQHQLYKGQL